MIKNKKGISVISVIITIIILIMIASITTFTGTSMLNNTRRKAAEDRLKIIYNAIIAHEEELGYANWFEPLTITDRQYDIMGLSDYADEGNFTPVSVSKSIDPSDNTKRIYKLETLIKKNSKEPPVILEQSYNAGISTSNTKIEFDVKKVEEREEKNNGF